MTAGRRQIHKPVRAPRRLSRRATPSFPSSQELLICAPSWSCAKSRANPVLEMALIMRLKKSSQLADPRNFAFTAQSEKVTGHFCVHDVAEAETQAQTSGSAAHPPVECTYHAE